MTLTSEDGQVLEAVVSHVPGAAHPTFNLSIYDSAQAIEDTYQTLYTCPVEAA
jgi:hypothetical protein